MKKRHVNIPVFIPHLGCPNNCVFCNQRAISGRREFDITSVDNIISEALSTIDSDASETEIAFFGGSFTGIERSDMIYLLEKAKSYIDIGKVSSIRLSTRPDYIDDEILEILSSYSVKTIELGIQCLDDNVLAVSKRGHTCEQSLNACKLVKQAGFELVGQMMIGLPASDVKAEVYTAEKLCESGVDAARIYPTMVFGSTELAEMTKLNLYAPLTLDDAVFRTREALFVFVRHSIPVIRIGLCSAENLYAEDGICAGAYHCAIGELVQSEVYYKIISEKLNEFPCGSLKGKNIVILSPRGEVSKIIGQKRNNKLKIQHEYNVKNVKVIENDTLSEYNIGIEITEG